MPLLAPVRNASPPRGSPPPSAWRPVTKPSLHPPAPIPTTPSLIWGRWATWRVSPVRRGRTQARRGPHPGPGLFRVGGRLSLQRPAAASSVPFDLPVAAARYTCGSCWRPAGRARGRGGAGPVGRGRGRLGACSVHGDMKAGASESRQGDVDTWGQDLSGDVLWLRAPEAGVWLCSVCRGLSPPSHLAPSPRPSGGPSSARGRLPPPLGLVGRCVHSARRCPRDPRRPTWASWTRTCRLREDALGTDTQGSEAGPESFPLCRPQLGTPTLGFLAGPRGVLWQFPAPRKLGRPAGAGRGPRQRTGGRDPPWTAPSSPERAEVGDARVVKTGGPTVMG